MSLDLDIKYFLMIYSFLSRGYVFLEGYCSILLTISGKVNCSSCDVTNLDVHTAVILGDGINNCRKEHSYWGLVWDIFVRRDLRLKCRVEY